MRPSLPARLLLVVALVLGLLPALTLTMRASPVAAGVPGGGGPTPGCATGTELVSNGSLEFPGTSLGIDDDYVPTGWSRVRVADVRYSDTISAQGSLHASTTQPASQTMDLSAYAGATLRFSMIETTHTVYQPQSVTLGTQTIPLARTPGAASGSITLPRSFSSTGTLTLTISIGSGGYGVFDLVSLTVAECGVLAVPNAAPVFANGAHTDQTLEATGPTGASGYTVPKATDADAVTDANPTGAVAVSCSPAPTATFAIGSTTPVTCTALDTVPDGAEPLDAPVAVSFDVIVRDSSGPGGITWVGGPQRNTTYTTRNVPAAPTCTATDTASPVIQCRVTGYSNQPGRHIMTARARDAAGNVTVETRTYTVTGTTQPTATPVTPRPTTPVVTPAPTTPPTAVPTRPSRTPVATPTPAPTQPPVGPTRPPRR